MYGQGTPIDAIADRVTRDLPVARDIGFHVPERYNASAILFDNLAAGRGDRPALLGEFGTVTYAQLCADAARFGNALVALGLARGDRVLMLLDDTPVYPAAIFGAIRAGFVPVLLNTQSPADLVAYYLADSGAPVAIVEAGLANLLPAGDAAPATTVVANGPAADGTMAWTDFLAGHPADLAAADTGRDEMAFWMYSSGSTGRPKGIVHLQHDMAYTQDSYGRHLLRLSDDDICYSPPKIFFAYGFGNAITFPFSVGAATVLVPGRPEPACVFAAIAAHRPTVFFGLPTLYNALVGAPEATAADLSSIRLCVSAAETLSAELAKAWQDRFGHEIVEGLGSTEVLHIYLSNVPGGVKQGSAGKAVPGYEIRLRDDDGRDVGPGEPGIMWVRGDSNTPCYWNKPDKTQETMRGDGWIYTSDRFTVDTDGYYFFQGRADDLIKVSGQWVYPLEIELCLADHPAVRECAVFGVKMADQRLTTQAFVVVEAGHTPGDALTADLQGYVKGRLLPYKYPRLVAYVDALPKTGSGKIDRQKLKESLA
jgi:benzoate-CoA ligase family protein